MDPSDQDRDADLDLALRRAGIALPPGRYAGVLASYRDLQTMLPLLRNGRTAAAEPAGTYDLDSIMRGPQP